MDRAVLDAYGWTDVPTDCDFFSLHPEDENPEEDDRTRKKTPKFRYRWPDEIQNDVLARLLDLNTHRATRGTRSHRTASVMMPTSSTAMAMESPSDYLNTAREVLHQFPGQIAAFHQTR